MCIHETVDVPVRHSDGDGWVEVGECGLAARHVLSGAGMSESVSGIAMGWGLDRLLMLRKGIDDIRLLRAEDPRIAVATCRSRLR